MRNVCDLSVLCVLQHKKQEGLPQAFSARPGGSASALFHPFLPLEPFMYKYKLGNVPLPPLDVLFIRPDMFVHNGTRVFNFPCSSLSTPTPPHTRPHIYIDICILISCIDRLLHCGVNCKCREILGCNLILNDCCRVLVSECEAVCVYTDNSKKKNDTPVFPSSENCMLWHQNVVQPMLDFAVIRFQVIKKNPSTILLVAQCVLLWVVSRGGFSKPWCHPAQPTFPLPSPPVLVDAWTLLINWGGGEERSPAFMNQVSQKSQSWGTLVSFSLGPLMDCVISAHWVNLESVVLNKPSNWE